MYALAFVILSAPVFTPVGADVDSVEAQLKGLRSSGILIKSDGAGKHPAVLVVPHNSNVGPKDIERLMRYCRDHAPNAEVAMYGPIVVDAQLQQFRQMVPSALVTHESAVWFGITHRRRLDSGDHNRVCRVQSVQQGSTAEEAGLLKGDIILGIGEYRWPEGESYDGYLHALKRQIPGQRSTVTVKRKGKLITFPVAWRMLPSSAGRPY